MQVQIKNVEVEWKGEGAKRWGKASVLYTFNGQARSQNVMSFTNPDVFKKVQELTGQTVEVEVAKNDKGYNEWKSITVAGHTQSTGSGSGTGNASSGSAATRVTGSTYETREERAARQTLIIKQSSVSNAISALTPGAKTGLDQEAVLNLAEVLYNWVVDGYDVKTNTLKPDLSIDSMDDDIPF